MFEYQIGGSLSVNSPTYVDRAADTDLYQALLNRAFCYILTSRQMGKSSLRVQTRHRLESEGQGRCAVVDMTRIGSRHLTHEQWYQGLAFDIARKLGQHHQGSFTDWWQSLGGVPPVQKLSQFIETVLLANDSQAPIFIFLDEIDSVRALDFAVDDFFSFMRYCYNERAENPVYRRLTWALFGVATPRDLVQPVQETPFNIGHAIHLSGFTLAEAAPLSMGLMDIAQQPQSLLAEILHWTGGQPFLTQKVCWLMQEAYSDRPIAAGTEAQMVESLVRSRLIQNWEVQDDPEHLRTIRDRLTADRQRSGRLLSLYQRLLTQGALKADGGSEQAELKLSGIAIEQSGQLHITNPIYAAVFNHSWIHHCLSYQRPYAAAFDAWVASDYQDESRLLMGQALAEALNWASDKSLSDLDYRFLSASQAWNAKMLGMELEAQAKANQMLADAQRQAQRIIWWGYISLGMCLVISLVALAAGLRR